MSFDDTIKRVQQRIIDNWTETEFEFENDSLGEYPPEYISVSVMDREPVTGGIAGTQSYTWDRGMIVVNIFTPREEGAIRPRELAKAVSVLFEHKRFGPIRCYNTQVKVLGEVRVPGETFSTKWYQTNVMTTYRRLRNV